MAIFKPEQLYNSQCSFKFSSTALISDDGIWNCRIENKYVRNLETFHNALKKYLSYDVRIIDNFKQFNIVAQGTIFASTVFSVSSLVLSFFYNARFSKYMEAILLAIPIIAYFSVENQQTVLEKKISKKRKLLSDAIAQFETVNWIDNEIQKFFKPLNFSYSYFGIGWENYLTKNAKKSNIDVDSPMVKIWYSRMKIKKMLNYENPVEEIIDSNHNIHKGLGMYSFPLTIWIFSDKYLIVYGMVSIYNLILQLNFKCTKKMINECINYENIQHKIFNITSDVISDYQK